MSHAPRFAGVGRRRFFATGAIASLLFVAACTIGPPGQEPPATYDLGPPGASTPAGAGVRVTLLVPKITAPAWLDHAGIAYRLGYDNLWRHQVYANSRWVAAPAVLLTQRLRSRIAGTATVVLAGEEGVRADYMLHVDLEDFSQFFETPETSRAAVAVRASLIRLTDRAVRAQRHFLAQGSAVPDAAGAVASLAVASDTIIRDLLRWTADNIAADQSTVERKGQ